MLDKYFWNLFYPQIAKIYFLAQGSSLSSQQAVMHGCDTQNWQKCHQLETFLLRIIISVPLLRSETHIFISASSAGLWNSSVSCVKTHCITIKSHKKYSYCNILKTTGLFYLILRVIGGKMRGKKPAFSWLSKSLHPLLPPESKGRRRKIENNTFSSFSHFCFPLQFKVQIGSITVF